MLSLFESENKLKEVLPIDIFLNNSENEMLRTFQSAKYAVKLDPKGWTTNASSHITALANACILYTNSSAYTPNEYLAKGRFADTIIFCNKISSNSDPDMLYRNIINDIIARESNSQLNKITLHKVRQLLEEKFSVEIIVKKLCKNYLFIK